MNDICLQKEVYTWVGHIWTQIFYRSFKPCRIQKTETLNEVPEESEVLLLSSVIILCDNCHLPPHNGTLKHVTYDSHRTNIKHCCWCISVLTVTHNSLICDHLSTKLLSFCIHSCSCVMAWWWWAILITSYQLINNCDGLCSVWM
jgi:hypothetical protein